MALQPIAASTEVYKGVRSSRASGFDVPLISAVGGKTPGQVGPHKEEVMIDPVLAYVDPGIGATLAQLAVAGTAGIGAIGKLRMNKIKRRIGRNEQPEPGGKDTAADEVPAPTE